MGKGRGCKTFGQVNENEDIRASNANAPDSMSRLKLISLLFAGLILSVHMLNCLKLAQEKRLYPRQIITAHH